MKLGYRPATVPLGGFDDHDALAARCHVLQAEMLQWAVELRMRGHRASHYDGTFGSLVRYYETHQDSPYIELAQSTQLSYSKTMALLMKHKGKRLVSAVDASDIKRWYKELCEAHSRGWAALSINILKAILAFGSSKRLPACRVLRQELRDVTFHGGERRTQYLRHEEITAFCTEAEASGLAWMARTVRLQFDCGLRRRDVIGTYEDEAGTHGIRIGARVWRDGLTWLDLKDGVIMRVVSKTRFTSGAPSITHIADYPDLATELEKTPLEQRVGPMVIHPLTDRPPTEAQCRAAFRLIARKVGIPDNVWNMDARAGAVTEAYEGGATAEEAMALGQHSREETNRRYLRKIEEQSRRAAAKRMAHRAK